MSINDIDDDVNDAMLQHESMLVGALAFGKGRGALGTGINDDRKFAGLALSSSLSSITHVPLMPSSTTHERL